MSSTGTVQQKRGWVFWAGFALATVLIATVVSYFASSSPDGLDSATLHGCEVTETAAGEELTGTCIAQDATDHPLAASPLADYAIAGVEHTGGLAGLVGVAVTLLIAGGGFWLIARSRSSKD